MDLISALGGTPQRLWMRERVWHPTRSSCREPVAIFLDTGANGGKYTSVKFCEAIQTSGRRLAVDSLNSKGPGCLHAVQHESNHTPLMAVSGSTVITLVYFS